MSDGMLTGYMGNLSINCIQNVETSNSAPLAATQDQ